MTKADALTISKSLFDQMQFRRTDVAGLVEAYEKLQDGKEYIKKWFPLCIEALEETIEELKNELSEGSV